MTRRRTRASRGRKGGDIVTVARDGDVMGARFDKMVSNQRYNESATPILVKAVAGVSTAAAAGSGVYTMNELGQEDDFASMAQQFRLFKVKAMRFEVFHINPSSVVPLVMSTFHSDGSLAGVTGQPATVDGEDSKYMDPGNGKQVFYWNASSPEEKLYQDPTSFVSFGGLRWYRESGSTAVDVPLVRIIVTAQVIFRGRV